MIQRILYHSGNLIEWTYPFNEAQAHSEEQEKVNHLEIIHKHMN